MMANTTDGTQSTATAPSDAGWPELPDSIAELRGSMIDGYDDDRVNRVLGRISAATGLDLVCVWASYDAWGKGAGATRSSTCSRTTGTCARSPGTCGAG
jgi:hypothetical protein